VFGPSAIFGAYLDSAAPEFGFLKLWLLNTDEIGDTTRKFGDSGLLTANLGACGCDDMCRYDA
jgi:hypothetical protein